MHSAPLGTCGDFQTASQRALAKKKHRRSNVQLSKFNCQSSIVNAQLSMFNCQCSVVKGSIVKVQFYQGSVLSRFNCQCSIVKDSAAKRGPPVLVALQELRVRGHVREARDAPRVLLHVVVVRLEVRLHADLRVQHAYLECAPNQVGHVLGVCVVRVRKPPCIFGTFVRINELWCTSRPIFEESPDGEPPFAPKRLPRLSLGKTRLNVHENPKYFRGLARFP